MPCGSDSSMQPPAGTPALHLLAFVPAYGSGSASARTPVFAALRGAAARVTLVILLLVPAVSPAAHESLLKLSLNSPSGHRRITAGEENAYRLEVKNTGLLAITDIRLSARTPENWQISFTPATLASLEPGKIAEVEVTISVPRRVEENYYAVWLRARSEAADETLSISLRVETPPGKWLAVALVLTVALLAAFVVVFIRVSSRD
jgi:hypothetical protein